MKLIKYLVAILALTSVVQAKSQTMWASIPFIRGADLCAYKQAYSQTRYEYMQDMVGLASDLMQAGAKGKEALQMLQTFDAMYDKNLYLATQHKYLDVTLENSLKGYLDGYYRSYPVSDRKFQFRHMNDIRTIINNASNDRRTGYVPADSYSLVDYIAYGTYSFAPNCKGNIQVTLTMVDNNGNTSSYQAIGSPSVVMSQIASRIFEDFQGTKFPNTLFINGRSLQLVGTHNGTIGKATSMRQAESACKNRGARLPSADELEAIDAFGDWNGGVSIGRRVWAISGGMVYHPGLMNPSPVRSPRSINAKEYSYYCVK
ncbi:hypothetical protein [Bacteriovorax sp. Seq25_V]|uniref:hypothetical protein n=1 Tax=Bacteriovorax sp. Seq25_V TaxID=1201288 RepID=UPI00038A4444|nr:hypothetical protein [Bacteriovorax sp. Seq25_V]EQC43248.1 hypothetical protein M900_0251 [Bacteriovorax sp. Seq25_V]